MRYRKIKPYNITIGPLDLYEDELDKQTAVVYFNDAFPPKMIDHPHFYWIPIVEDGKWGYSPFFASKRILDELITNRKDSVYVCCAAGAHRSPVLTYMWLRSIGLSESYIEEIFEDADQVLRQYKRDVEKGNVPRDIAKLHKQMKEFPTYSLMGILATMDKRGQS